MSLFELCGAGIPALLIRLTYIDEKLSIDSVNAFGVHTKTRKICPRSGRNQGVSTHAVFGVMRYGFECEELSARLKLPYPNTEIPLLGERDSRCNVNLLQDIKVVDEPTVGAALCGRPAPEN